MSESPPAPRGMFVRGRLLRPQGFTLLELMLVLLVIALAGVLVYPNLQPLLGKTRVEGTVKKTATFLDDIRLQSVNRGKVLILGYDDENRRLTVRERGGEEEDVLISRDIPADAGEITLEPEEVRYFPQGHSSGGELAFKSGNRFSYLIEIGSFTGIARVREAEL